MRAMQNAFAAATLLVVFVCVETFDAAGQTVDQKTVYAFFAQNKETKPSTKFSADVSAVSLLWKGKGLQAGDKIRTVWIAEDVGQTAPKESKIAERAAVVYKSDENGVFSLSRPGDRSWPVGTYRTEIYIGNQFVQALRFTIEPGTAVEVPKSQ
jgi:hypothetical protein